MATARAARRRSLSSADAGLSRQGLRLVVIFIGVGDGADRPRRDLVVVVVALAAAVVVVGGVGRPPRLISSLDLRARRHRDASRTEPPRGASPPLSTSSEEDGAPPDGRLAAGGGGAAAAARERRRRGRARDVRRPWTMGFIFMCRAENPRSTLHRRLRHAVP